MKIGGYILEILIAVTIASLIVLILLIAAVAARAQTNSAAFNAGMAQAMSIVTNAIAHPETVGINPVINNSLTTETAAQPVQTVTPLAKPLTLHLTCTPPNLPATNAAGQALTVYWVRCPVLTAPPAYWRGSGVGTNVIVSTTNTDGYWPETGQCYYRAGAVYETMK